MSASAKTAGAKSAGAGAGTATESTPATAPAAGPPKRRTTARPRAAREAADTATAVRVARPAGDRRATAGAERRGTARARATDHPAHPTDATHSTDPAHPADATHSTDPTAEAASPTTTRAPRAPEAEHPAADGLGPAQVENAPGAQPETAGMPPSADALPGGNGILSVGAGDAFPVGADGTPPPAADATPRGGARHARGRRPRSGDVPAASAADETPTAADAAPVGSAEGPNAGREHPAIGQAAAKDAGNADGGHPAVAVGGHPAVAVGETTATEPMDPDNEHPAVVVGPAAATGATNPHHAHPTTAVSPAAATDAEHPHHAHPATAVSPATVTDAEHPHDPHPTPAVGETAATGSGGPHDPHPAAAVSPVAAGRARGGEDGHGGGLGIGGGAAPLMGLPEIRSAGLPVAVAAGLPRVGVTEDAGDACGTVSAHGAPSLHPARAVLRRTGFTLTADGAYGACLAEAEGGGWFAERWTLGGPEAYSVPLPGAQPEEPGTPVAPLSDGRVLVLRRVADRYDAVLLAPTGPGTGEVALGSLVGDEVRLLPPSPAPGTAFVLACAAGTCTVWQVLGGGAPVPVATVDGRCTGGVWLDRAGRLLALDLARDGRAKTVAADLRTGAVSPLLQLTEDSDDRLVLAEPDSGLLVVRSDAAGGSRLGWGVLGSARPVRFPDALCVPGLQFGPVAAQPGQILSPESVVVALRAEAPGGAETLALWRPGERRVHWRAAPAGWLSGAGLWLPGTDLRLPYAAPEPGMMRYDTPPADPPVAAVTGAPVPRVVREPGRPAPVRRSAAVLPLQQAPLQQAPLQQAPLAASVSGSPA